MAIIKNRCRVCGEIYAPENYPMCSQCGCFLIDTDDLDLSPNAPLDVIFKRMEKE